jgi:Periplasmic serine proteases (ClpP class)
MANFLRIYVKTLAFFASIFTILFLTSLIFNYYEKSDQSNFVLFNGDKDSSNIIAIIDIDGLIIEGNDDLSRLSNRRIISPTLIKNYLIELEKISPNVIIFSINSPGGTVSASKEIYDLNKHF